MIDNQLKLIAATYDKAIDLGRKGIDLYKDLPEHITNDPDYPLYQKILDDGTGGGEQQKIYSYLCPEDGMNFIDLGCCLNFMFRGYDKWPSVYYGVDISGKTIQLLKEYAEKKQLKAGSFFCCSMHQTPYADNFFDIAACIGSLEYFEKDFITEIIKEEHRILKPNGRIVLDIPDIESPEGRMAMKIEEYLGRPDKFNMTDWEFEELLQMHFAIDRKEKAGPMKLYFLRCKKTRSSQAWV